MAHPAPPAERPAFYALAYDLEWFGGRFHNDFWLPPPGGVPD